jgi:hypothetical protein
MQGAWPAIRRIREHLDVTGQEMWIVSHDLARVEDPRRVECIFHLAEDRCELAILPLQELRAGEPATVFARD